MRKHNLASERFVATALALALCGAPLANAQKPVRTLSSSDTTFMKDAAEGGMDEVRLGEMAQQNAASDRVKMFGEKMIDEHTKMGSELQALAARKNVALPKDISITQKVSNKLLSAKSGDSFDRSYISSMLRDHKDNITAFQKEASSGVDEDVRAFASKALPTLREHLRMAEDLARDLGIGE
jgi:putative membrane protein